MNAGKLDSKITLYTTSSGSRDSCGQFIPTYVTSSVWAKVEEKSGNQALQNGILADNYYYDFTIRYTSAANENTEIVYDGERYRTIFLRGLGHRDQYIVLSAQRKT